MLASSGHRQQAFDHKVSFENAKQYLANKATQPSPNHAPGVPTPLADTAYKPPSVPDAARQRFPELPAMQGEHHRLPHDGKGLPPDQTGQWLAHLHPMLVLF